MNIRQQVLESPRFSTLPAEVDTDRRPWRVGVKLALAGAFLVGCGPVMPPAGVPTESMPSTAPIPVAPAPLPIEIGPPEAPLTELLGVGATGPYIANMEKWLAAVGCAGITINSIYDPSESDILSIFKRSKAIPDGGNYGPLTYPELKAAADRPDTNCGWNDRPVEPKPALPAAAPARQLSVETTAGCGNVAGPAVPGDKCLDGTPAGARQHSR